MFVRLIYLQLIGQKELFSKKGNLDFIYFPRGQKGKILHCSFTFLDLNFFSLKFCFFNVVTFKNTTFPNLFIVKFIQLQLTI